MTGGEALRNRGGHNWIRDSMEDQGGLAECGLAFVAAPVLDKPVAEEALVFVAVVVDRDRALALPAVQIFRRVAFPEAGRKLKRRSHQHQPFDLRVA